MLIQLPNPNPIFKFFNQLDWFDERPITNIQIRFGKNRIQGWETCGSIAHNSLLRYVNGLVFILSAILIQK